MGLSDLLNLTKIRITLPVALSGFTGFLLYRPEPLAAVLPVTGILLLAMGSAALNNIQEARYDALMQRTSSRPLPSGRMSGLFALTLMALLVLGGSLLLLLSCNLSFVLGLLTLLCYNAIYTPLKRVTAWAVIPGSLTGALPPAIGWIAAGGPPDDKLIVFLCVFFFIGQIPHFWLLLLTHGPDYLKAGFKSLSAVFSPKQIQIITYSWIVATAALASLIPLMGFTSGMIAFYGIPVLSGLLCIISPAYLGRQVRRLFMIFNIYYLLIMLLLWIDALSCTGKMVF